MYYKWLFRHKLIVTTGGLMACGEILHITQTSFGVFDKEVYSESSTCLRGIERIEISRMDERQAEFLIYHNGEMSTQNPLHYFVERKNGW